MHFVRTQWKIRRCRSIGNNQLPEGVLQSGEGRGNRRCRAASFLRFKWWSFVHGKARCWTNPTTLHAMKETMPAQLNVSYVQKRLIRIRKYINI
uniref:Uncharacterized protein n=1 Tax=Anguilla anguilla TaxID=7936 RepID=A0A0E9X7K5_ANGAN